MSAREPMVLIKHVRAWDEWLAWCECGWTGSYVRVKAQAETEAAEHTRLTGHAR